MVVVDLGGGLVVVRAEDAAGVLDEPSLLGDGRSEEEGVQRRAVESFPGVWTGRHGEQGRPARLGLEPGERGGPCFGAHAAAQDDGIVAYRAQCVGELVQVRGPVSEHEAIPAQGQRSHHVGDNLPGPPLVGDQVLVNDGNPAWSRGCTLASNSLCASVLDVKTSS